VAKAAADNGFKHCYECQSQCSMSTVASLLQSALARLLHVHCLAVCYNNRDVFITDLASYASLCTAAEQPNSCPAGALQTQLHYTQSSCLHPQWHRQQLSAVNRSAQCDCFVIFSLQATSGGVRAGYSLSSTTLTAGFCFCLLVGSSTVFSTAAELDATSLIWPTDSLNSRRLRGWALTYIMETV
jgi:hypothetical protein